MTSTTLDTPIADERTSVAEKVVDAYRQAVEVGHKARLLKHRAADAVEDGVYATKRAIKVATRSVQNAADLRDEAAYRVKREPLKVVGLAFGAGVLVGVVVAWASRRPVTLTSSASTSPMPEDDYA